MHTHSHSHTHTSELTYMHARTAVSFGVFGALTTSVRVQFYVCLFACLLACLLVCLFVVVVVVFRQAPVPIR